MKRMYTFETRYFPMIKNSWGWIKNDSSFLELELKDISIGFEQNKILFEEIIEFFKSY